MSSSSTGMGREAYLLPIPLRSIPLLPLKLPHRRPQLLEHLNAASELLFPANERCESAVALWGSTERL